MTAERLEKIKISMEDAQSIAKELISEEYVYCNNIEFSNEEMNVQKTDATSPTNFKKLTEKPESVEVLASLRVFLAEFYTEKQDELWTATALPGDQHAGFAASLKFNTRSLFDIYRLNKGKQRLSWNIYIGNISYISDDISVSKKGDRPNSGNRIEGDGLIELIEKLQSRALCEKIQNSVMPALKKSRPSNNQQLKIYLLQEQHQTPADHFESSKNNSNVPRYSITQRRNRLHQSRFRNEVLEMWESECFFCKRKNEGILDAAHLIPDSVRASANPENGRPLCPNHHRAFDNDPQLLMWDDKKGIFYYPPGAEQIEPFPPTLK